MGIINDKFMLRSQTSEKLYNRYAKDMPIIDYHCHLDPGMIAEDRHISDAYELFLGGDHYKWRQMRSFGIDEKYITGDADGFEKWLGFAKLMPYLIGNPLYHWTALELKRYFDIDKPLCEKTAKEIWDICNEKLNGDDFSVRNLILKSNVEVICTTDDPADDLKYHKKLRADHFKTTVLPTFRPDKAMGIDKEGFVEYIKEADVCCFAELVKWLESRAVYFNQNGCRLSDHSLESVPYLMGDASAAFDKRMLGKVLTQEETETFKTALLSECAKIYSHLGWTMQLHIGAMRNNNSKMFKILGADSGFDSINDLCIAEKLSRLLDSFCIDEILPKTILYTLNPKDNYVLGTIIGNFQSGPVCGKLQFGSGWWFNDNEDGMISQLKALGNLGILGKFIGMLTDSRSFVSYPRHEYFRRILCNLLGEWVESGKYPEDFDLLGTIVKGISYSNAKEYFGF